MSAPLSAVQHQCTRKAHYWRNLALCPVCEQIERNKLKGGRNE